MVLAAGVFALKVLLGFLLLLFLYSQNICRRWGLLSALTLPWDWHPHDPLVLTLFALAWGWPCFCGCSQVFVCIGFTGAVFGLSIVVDACPLPMCMLTVCRWCGSVAAGLAVLLCYRLAQLVHTPIALFLSG